MRPRQLNSRLLKNKVVWDFQKLQNNTETPTWSCTPEKISTVRNMKNIGDFVDSVTTLRNPSLDLFNVILSKCHEWSDAPLSSYIVNTMKRLDIAPNIETYFLLIRNWGPHRTLNYNYSVELTKIIIKSRKDCNHPDFFLNQSSRFKEMLAAIVLSDSNCNDNKDKDKEQNEFIEEETIINTEESVNKKEANIQSFNFDNKTLGSLQAYTMYLLTDPVDGNIHGPSFLNGIQCAIKLVYDLAKYNKFARKFILVLDDEMAKEYSKATAKERNHEEATKMGDVKIPLVNSQFFELDIEDKCFLDMALLRICSLKGYRESREFVWKRLRTNATGALSINLVIQVWSSCIKSLLDSNQFEYARTLTLQCLADESWMQSVNKSNIDTLVQPYFNYLRKEGLYTELQDFFIKYLNNYELSQSYCLLLLHTFLKSSPPPRLSDCLNLLDGFPIIVKSSISAHNKILRYLMEKNSFESAESYFNKLIEQGVIPNSTSYNIILQGFLATQKTTELMNFFTYMKSIKKDDMHTYSLLLTELPKIWTSQAEKAGFIYGIRRPKLKKKQGFLTTYAVPKPKENYKDPCKFQKIFFNALLQDLEERGFNELRNKFIHYYHQSHQHFQVMDYYRFYRKTFDFQPSALIDVMDSAGKTKMVPLIDEIFDDIIYKKKYSHVFTNEMLIVVVSAKLKTIMGFSNKVDFIRRIQQREYGNFGPTMHVYNMLVFAATKNQGRDIDITTERMVQNINMIVQRILREPKATRFQIQRTINYLQDFVVDQTNKNKNRNEFEEGLERIPAITLMLQELTNLYRTLPE